MSRSEELFEKAKKRMPGGVNSPVRAFQAVGGHPRFMERADGPYIWDVDGNRYIDYIGSWGPMILGHNGRADLRYGPLCGDAEDGQFWYRGSHVSSPGSQRLHRPQQDHQV